MLEVTLRSRSSSCKINDNLELEIIRENVGSHDLVVPRSLAWGGGRTNIWVYDDKGKEVVTTFLADELPPPLSLGILLCWIAATSWEHA